MKDKQYKASTHEKFRVILKIFYKVIWKQWGICYINNLLKILSICKSISYQSLLKAITHKTVVIMEPYWRRLWPVNISILDLLSLNYCKKPIWIVWLLVIFKGGIGFICFWEGSTLAIVEVNDSIIVIYKVKIVAINIE